MKSFVKYISKCFISFSIFILALIFLNIVAFIGTFYGVITRDYGETAPRNVLQNAAEVSSLDGMENSMKEKLQEYGIWAMFLDQDGNCVWSVDLPKEIPSKYTVQEVAVFSRGYLEDYPVFVWSDKNGLLVLGYPKGSYTKLTSNYYATDMLKAIPAYFAAIFVLDIILLFTIYYMSKYKLLKDTEPIISSINKLAEGKLISLAVNGELAEVSNSVNKVSHMLSNQNEARANWISGVSHDIRTPLSMIMGYAERIATDESASVSVREQAKIVRNQSTKIKELVQDLNLVSQLEYEMQPINKQTIRLSKLLRSYAADLLNSGLSENYSIEIRIDPTAEKTTLDCDARLISRAIHNLVQNSIGHNPQGCTVRLSLNCFDEQVFLSIADDGIGLSPDKLKELEEKTHYVEASDEHLDLRHGLGIILVRQITEAHGGTMNVESKPKEGCKTTLSFCKKNPKISQRTT